MQNKGQITDNRQKQQIRRKQMSILFDNKRRAGRSLYTEYIFNEDSQQVRAWRRDSHGNWTCSRKILQTKMFGEQYFSNANGENTQRFDNARNDLRNIRF